MTVRKITPITSASVITKDKEEIKYGRVEVRAKMPEGKGAWPAIWALGANRDSIGWPGCGEIDIVEWLGWAPQFITGSLYTITVSGDDTALITPYLPFNFFTLSTKFHNYAIEWDRTQIKYFYDNKNYATYKSSQITEAEWEPFTKPFYLLLNLAMGGTGGKAIDYKKFPFVFKIDYVRYYRKLQ